MPMTDNLSLQEIIDEILKKSSQIKPFDYYYEIDENRFFKQKASDSEIESHDENVELYKYYVSKYISRTKHIK